MGSGTLRFAPTPSGFAQQVRIRWGLRPCPSGNCFTAFGNFGYAQTVIRHCPLYSRMTYNITGGKNGAKAIT